MRIYPNQHWAALKVTDVRMEEFTAYLGGGVTERDTVPVATLSCKCGNTIKRRIKDIPRQDEMRDCGCGIGQDVPLTKAGRPKSTEPHIVTTIRLETCQYDTIKQYASDHNQSFNRAISELAALGLAAAD